jgi:hypothetical protein
MRSGRSAERAAPVCGIMARERVVAHADTSRWAVAGGAGTGGGTQGDMPWAVARGECAASDAMSADSMLGAARGTSDARSGTSAPALSGADSTAPIFCAAVRGVLSKDCAAGPLVKVRREDGILWPIVRRLVSWSLRRWLHAPFLAHRNSTRKT